MITLDEHFLDASEADRLLATLTKETPWKHEPIVMFGKEIMQPRLTCWYGDPGATYKYSGLLNEPLPFTDTLRALKHRIEAKSEHTFNSVLMNLYRDGQDSVGYHADDEKELGQNPFIASLSLGATRRLIFIGKNKRKERFEMKLTHGSLLLMGGDTQHVYKHAVPKEPEVTAPRINLTFRRVAGA